MIFLVFAPISVTALRMFFLVTWMNLAVMLPFVRLSSGFYPIIASSILSILVSSGTFIIIMRGFLNL